GGEEGREQIVVVLVDREIVEALARWSRKLEFGNLAQGRTATRDAGCARSSSAGNTQTTSNHERNAEEKREHSPPLQTDLRVSSTGPVSDRMRRERRTPETASPCCRGHSSRSPGTRWRRHRARRTLASAAVRRCRRPARSPQGRVALDRSACTCRGTHRTSSAAHDGRARRPEYRRGSRPRARPPVEPGCSGRTKTSAPCR